MNRYTLLGLLVTVGMATMGCGGLVVDPDRERPVVEGCATTGKSYHLHTTEVSGDCGPMLEQVASVDGERGTTTACGSADVTQQGCAMTGNACGISSDAADCRVVLTVSFADDGQSATGTETVTCTGKLACRSTYDVTATRSID